MSPVVVLSCLLGIVCLTLCVWSNALNCYFYNDDFLQLPYFYKTFHGHIDWLFRDLVSPWLGPDRQYIVLYRPLTQLTLALDFLISGGDPLGYHLSNIIYHTICCGAIFFLCEELLSGYAKKQAHFLSFAAAALFCVSPLHSETVCWAPARADLLCGALYTIALTLLLRAQRVESAKARIAGIVCFCLSLFCKEPAITLPVVLVLYNLLVGDVKADGSFASDSDSSIGSKRNLLQCAASFLPGVLSALKATRILWIAVVAYLVLRFLVLGTLTGGFVGSLGEELNKTAFVRWIVEHPFEYMIFPLRILSFPDGHWLRYLLSTLYLIAGFSLILQNWTSRKMRFCLWLALWSLGLLVLNFQVFHLNANLSGGRVCYLIMIPLTILFVVAVSPLASLGSRIPRLQWILAAPLLAAFVMFLPVSTSAGIQAWIQAGLEIRALKHAVEQQLQRTPEPKKLVIFDLPYVSNGCLSVVYPSNLAGLMQPPLSDKDLTSRLVAPESQPFIRLVRPELVRHVCSASQLYEPLIWQQASLKLVCPEALKAVPEVPSVRRRLECKQEDGYRYPSEWPRMAPEVAVDKMGDGRELLEVNAKLFELTTSTAFNRYLLLAAPQVVPAQYDFLELELSCNNSDSNSGSPVLNLLWNTSSFKTPFVVRCCLQSDGLSHKYLIPLAQQNRWILNDAITAITADIPAGFEVKISSAELVPATEVYPLLMAGDNQPMLIDGSYGVGAGKIKLVYDATRMAGAAKVKFELSKPNYAFEHESESYRVSADSPYALKHGELPGARGTLEVDAQFLEKGRGLYYLRVAALSDKGQVIGQYSDPVGITLR